MSCSRIAFIAPAGYGKTQAIVNRVKDTEGKALVLTHTNAGVTALGNRLRLAGVEPACCEVSTIASYCEKWVKAYPKTAGFDELSTFTGSAYYDQLYPAAGQVFSKDWAQHVLSESYSCVIVDEYQDCTICQQEALFALSAGLDFIVYGDPMQSIFIGLGILSAWKILLLASGRLMRDLTGGLTPVPKSWETRLRGFAMRCCRPSGAKACRFRWAAA
ncbi:MAG: AAA family ATPase [Senegalimassilia sp.]|nr:AAA family ATPase [Senegalimassilia sp.]